MQSKKIKASNSENFPRIFAICMYITELDLYVATKVTLYVDFLSDDYDER